MTAAALGDVADFINGYAFKPEDWHGDGLPIVRIQNLTDSSKPINLTTRAVPDKFRVRRGELLVSWSATLGVFVWDRTDEALVNQHIFRVVPSSKVDQNFLRHMLEGALVSMERHLHGATMRHVNRGEFLSTEIPLPPMFEQRRIAAILDRANDLRTKRRQVLACLDTLTQSIFHDMFGDVRANERGWTAVTVDDVAERVTDGEHKTPRRSDSGVPLLSARNVRDGWIDFDNIDFVDEEEFAILSRRIEPRPGDVLISCSGTIGRVAQVRERARFAMVRSAALVRPNQLVHPTFLERVLASPTLKATMVSQANSSAQANLFQNQIKRLPMVVPPLDLQDKFADRIDAVHAQRSLVVAALAAGDKLFASIQSRAFRGEL